MMNKKVLTTLLLGLGLMARPVYAIDMQAPTEFTAQLGHYAQKISSTALYIESIAEGVTYVKTVGQEKINAAMKYLSAGIGDIKKFQEKLHFSDAASFSSLLNVSEEALRAAADAKNKLIEEVEDTADELVGKAKDAAGNLLDEAVGKGQDLAKQEKDKLTPENVKKLAVDGSAVDKDSIVKTSYGAPQTTKEAAQKFIKSMYFYSSKEGDKYEGKKLNNTTNAHKVVQKNRLAYEREVLTNSYGVAMENLSASKGESQKRLQTLQKKLSSAETIEDKKAVEVLVVQEEARQRMLRLNLELTVLERDLVAELLLLPPNYIIARTPEQIEKDTREAMGQANYNKEEEKTLEDEIREGNKKEGKQ